MMSDGLDVTLTPQEPSRPGAELRLRKFALACKLYALRDPRRGQSETCESVGRSVSQLVSQSVVERERRGERERERERKRERRDKRRQTSKRPRKTDLFPKSAEYSRKSACRRLQNGSCAVLLALNSKIQIYKTLPPIWSFLFDKAIAPMRLGTFTKPPRKLGV